MHSKGQFTALNSACASLHVLVVQESPLSLPITRQRTWGGRRQGVQSIVCRFLNPRIDFHAPITLLECCEFWSSCHTNYLMNYWRITSRITSYLSIADWDLGNNDKLTTPLSVHLKDCLKWENVKFTHFPGLVLLSNKRMTSSSRYQYESPIQVPSKYANIINRN